MTIRAGPKVKSREPMLVSTEAAAGRNRIVLAKSEANSLAMPFLFGVLLRRGDHAPHAQSDLEFHSSSTSG